MHVEFDDSDFQICDATFHWLSKAGLTIGGRSKLTELLTSYEWVQNTLRRTKQVNEAITDGHMLDRTSFQILDALFTHDYSRV